VLLTSRPRQKAISCRATSWCRSSNACQATSPNDSARAVESTISVNRIVHSVRSEGCRRVRLRRTLSSSAPDAFCVATIAPSAS